MSGSSGSGGHPFAERSRDVSDRRGVRDRRGARPPASDLRSRRGVLVPRRLTEGPGTGRPSRRRSPPPGAVPLTPQGTGRVPGPESRRSGDRDRGRPRRPDVWTVDGLQPAATIARSASHHQLLRVAAFPHMIPLDRAPRRVVHAASSQLDRGPALDRRATTRRKTVDRPTPVRRPEPGTGVGRSSRSIHQAIRWRAYPLPCSLHLPSRLGLGGRSAFPVLPPKTSERLRRNAGPHPTAHLARRLGVWSRLPAAAGLLKEAVNLTLTGRSRRRCRCVFRVRLELLPSPAVAVTPVTPRSVGRLCHRRWPMSRSISRH